VNACCLLLLALVTPATAMAIDLGGVYVSRIEAFDAPCTLTFVQSGTSITITGPCTFGSTYTFDLAGTVDPSTGAFSASGRLINLCDAPGSATMMGTGDGETFTATATCGITSTVSGTKCGNGVIDATEDCEDGNIAAGDCCSPVCRFDSAGDACSPDANVCTLDQCDGAGHCQHPPDIAASGMPCAPDTNECTDDVCNATGQCVHPPNTASCEDGNACTGPDTCSGGTCVGGPIAPECAGPIDLTGDWELTASASVIGASTVSVHHFVQSGVTLQSSFPGGMTGVGSVNRATGVFESHTPYLVLGLFPCDEVINATASMDARSFVGTVVFYCGLEGTAGPFDIIGRRCALEGCPCAPTVACTPADHGARLVVRMRDGSSRIRWRWTHSPMPVSFSDPTATTDYQFCVETASGGSVHMAPHGGGWRATESGFRYAARAGMVRQLSLTSTAKKISLAASVKTDAAPTPPFSPPVRVRLLHAGTAPACFEADFATPTMNTAGRFRATE